MGVGGVKELLSILKCWFFIITIQFLDSLKKVKRSSFIISVKHNSHLNNSTMS